MPEFEKKNTINKPVALLSVVQCNSILQYIHFIVSTLLLYWSCLTLKCGLCTKWKWRFPSLGSINYVCVSAPGFPALLLKWFVLNHSVKSSIPESQWPGNHSAHSHYRDLAPHTCSLNWTERLVWLGEMGEKLKSVFVYKRRRFIKIKVKTFHCFASGEMCEWLHSCIYT